MSPPAAPAVARARFLQAAGSGAAEAPEIVRRTFETLATPTVKMESLDTLSITRGVMEEFSTSGTLFFTQAQDPASVERWVCALRWVLQELRAWTPDVANPALQLQVLLAALSAFDVENAGVDAVLEQMHPMPLTEGLRRLLECTAWRQVRADARGDTQLEKIHAAAQCGDFEQLDVLMRGLDLHPSGDSYLAIYLLWRLRPDLLASVINQKQDAIFGYGVCIVLGAQALHFALDVNDISFKFSAVRLFAVASRENTPSESIDKVSRLLQQVAGTPSWGSWLRALYKHPQGATITTKALPCALARVPCTHWADFVAAVQLWTQQETAVAVANILIDFYRMVGEQKAREMWSLAFQRWNQWDYGSAEGDAYMFAPSACSFDFPVAMHYASLPPTDVAAEEQRLVRVVESVELEWFTSQSDLISRRNRLLSRLRLLRHGQALAAGATVEPLPPSVRADGEYAALRYRWFKVGA